MTSRFILAAAFLVLPALAGSDTPLTPREMYYHKDDAPPPPTVVTSSTHNTPVKRRSKLAKQPDTLKTNAPATAAASPDTPAVVEKAASPTPPTQAGIGLRYALVKVTDSGTVDTSDNDVFHAGDCVQLKVESNSSGFLFVLHHGPDGKWQPLMPSPQMPDESNRIEAFRDVQIPAKYCFRFDDKPGIETLFLAVAQSENAIPELHRAILAGNHPNDKPADGPTMMALNLDHQVNALRGRGMEISQIERVVETPKDEAKAHAVYVVNRSDTDSDRVVAEIRLRHE